MNETDDMYKRVCKKMGCSIEEYAKEVYENVSKMQTEDDNNEWVPSIKKLNDEEQDYVLAYIIEHNYHIIYKPEPMNW